MMFRSTFLTSCIMSWSIQSIHGSLQSGGSKRVCAAVNGSAAAQREVASSPPDLISVASRSVRSVVCCCRLYNEEVDELYKKYDPVLQALYSRWRLRPPSGGLRTKARPDLYVVP